MTPQTRKEDEIAFLAEEFDIPAIRAASLIADDPKQAEALAAAEMRRQREADPLADVPSVHPKDAGHYPAPKFASAQEVPVENKRTGAG